LNLALKSAADIFVERFSLRDALSLLVAGTADGDGFQKLID